MSLRMLALVPEHMSRRKIASHMGMRDNAVVCGSGTRLTEVSSNFILTKNVKRTEEKLNHHKNKMMWLD